MAGIMDAILQSLGQTYANLAQRGQQGPSGQLGNDPLGTALPNPFAGPAQVGR